MASDPTFRSYKPDQAQKYAASRPSYPPALYEHIFAEHAAHGGGFEFLVDVGCGPGRATKDLALSFDHAVGVDPGQEMINVARERGGETKQGEKIRFELCEAEHLASVPGLPLGGVDLLTASAAAHWFDMKKFWGQAAQLVRPGGTVAFWTKGSYFCHPDMPHAAEVNAIQEEFGRVIAPYMQPGNVLTENMYDGLELPWTVDPTQTAFPEDKFRRFSWDRGGVLSDGKDFFGGTAEFSMDMYRHGLGTVSPVTRWREAHPELVGTDQDVVEAVYLQVRKIIGEGAMLKGGGATTLLMFTRGE